MDAVIEKHKRRAILVNPHHIVRSNRGIARGHWTLRRACDRRATAHCGNRNSNDPRKPGLAKSFRPHRRAGTSPHRDRRHRSLFTAFALTREMASMLVGIRATDPATFVTMAVVFFLIAAMASGYPPGGGKPRPDRGSSRRVTALLWQCIPECYLNYTSGIDLDGVNQPARVHWRGGYPLSRTEKLSISPSCGYFQRLLVCLYCGNAEFAARSGTVPSCEGRRRSVRVTWNCVLLSALRING